MNPDLVLTGSGLFSEGRIRIRSKLFRIRNTADPLLHPGRILITIISRPNLAAASGPNLAAATGTNLAAATGTNLAAASTYPAAASRPNLAAAS
jgi:hypothetical protein